MKKFILTGAAAILLMAAPVMADESCSISCKDICERLNIKLSDNNCSDYIREIIDSCSENTSVENRDEIINVIIERLNNQFGFEITTNATQPTTYEHITEATTQAAQPTTYEHITEATTQAAQPTTYEHITETTTQATQPTTKAEVMPKPEETDATTAETTKLTEITTTITTEATTETTTESLAVSSYAKQVLDLVNKHRANNGLASLDLDYELNNVAQIKAEDMKNNNYFSHTSPVYGSPFDMMNSFGITYKAAGENIAMGQKTPEEVVTGWMNSEGHRKNILNSAFTHMGLGYAKGSNTYWAQMFIGK